MSLPKFWAETCDALQALFCFELAVASSVRSGYFASLYFWIDLAATLSMLLDITRLMDLIFQQSTPAGADALTRPDQNKVFSCQMSLPACREIVGVVVPDQCPTSSVSLAHSCSRIS